MKIKSWIKTIDERKARMGMAIGRCEQGQGHLVLEGAITYEQVEQLRTIAQKSKAQKAIEGDNYQPSQVEARQPYVG